MADELADTGFMVIAVALEQNKEAIADFVDGITYPVLIDANHTVTELYSITNIPTVVWIDENDRIVRPNTAAPGTDTFKDFTGVSCEPHMDALRHWAHTGEVDIDADEVAGAVAGLSEGEVQARLHYRIALHARRTGDDEAARGHFDAAAGFAPHDFTIRRSAMPLTGGDPFGAGNMTACLPLRKA